MKQNMGNIDRIVRILAAIIITILYFTDTISGTLGYVLLGVATIFLLTSFISFCPLYSLFGTNTCQIKKKM